MNLLITDDEPLIHIAIEMSLKETTAADLCIFHASNGIEMLHQMEKQAIDIALVDIRMPGMDGLTAIEKARERWPGTHYYIMSGFSEFEYAREAVRLGVVEYLLKPLEPEQLSEIINKVRQEIIIEENQIRKSFQAWLVGALHRHDVSSFYNCEYYSATILICCDSDKEPQNDRISMYSAGIRNRISIPCWEGHLLMIYGRNEAELKNYLHSFMTARYPTEISCFVSSVSNDPLFLSDALHQILDYSPVRVLRGIGRCRKLNRISGADAEEISMGREWIDWRDCYLEKRFSDLVTKTPSLLPGLSKLTDSRIQNLAVFLSTVTGEKCPEPGDEASLRQFLKDICEDVIKFEAGTDRIDAVIQYVEENFCEDISVSVLSQKFDLSPNYISSLFKKKLGVNFIDHLTALRLTKAKTMLKSGNLSAKEIAESVGYYSQSYFNKIFLKYEGCTPGEYRKKVNTND
ncbi:MAG: response regulator [Anaerolineaceae bacterium]|nr:response regulator [Anaerolineaceae bacterium]